MKTGVWAGSAVLVAAGISAFVGFAVVEQERNPAPSVAQSHAEEIVEPAPSASLRLPVESPWSPGTAVTMTRGLPVPGETIQVEQCTVAYTFTAGERAYAVTASHCGSPGAYVWPTGDGVTADFSTPVGTFLYSDLYDINSSELDVGIIEITDRSYPMAEPNLNAATVLADEITALPDEICKYGSTTGHTCGPRLDSGGVEILADSHGLELKARASTAEVCARSGDSGGPVFATFEGEDVIIGLVSGTRDAVSELSCSESIGVPMTMSYTAMPEIQDVVDRVVAGAEYLNN